MWCTSQELFEMYEQINEDYPIESFRVILTQEKRNGTFIAKQLRSNDGRGKPLLYLRTDA